MLGALYIFVDDDFEDPIYADPDLEELEDELREKICTAVYDAIEGDGRAEGVARAGDQQIVWKTLVKVGISFVAVTDREILPKDVERYLVQLQRRYADEVTDMRDPEREGLEDVIVDVIPPWEE